MCARNVALRMQTNYDILLSFAQWMELLTFVENLWFDSLLQVILYSKLTKISLMFGSWKELKSMEDGRSTSIFSLYWQISQGWMAEFPVFVVGKV